MTEMNEESPGYLPPAPKSLDRLLREHKELEEEREELEKQLNSVKVKMRTLSSEIIEKIPIRIQNEITRS